MDTPTETLNDIERRAERALIQELRLLRRDLLRLRPMLAPEDQEHADALLLKLQRLADEESLVGFDAPIPEQAVLFAA